MLNRQKILLHLLRESGGRAGKLQVMKWAFLLSRADSSGGSAFYQFLPYHYGPYSFCLAQEMDALAKRDYVRLEGDKTWALTELGRQARPQVDQPVRADLWRILKDHRELSNSSLLRSVYQRYPWFSINSKVTQHQARPEADCAVYTAGYEGQSVDGFLNELMTHGIRRIIDVRRNPIARRYGYHKSTLHRLAGYVGIDYAHFPQLGIASEERQELHTFGDRLELFDRYAATTLKTEREAIAEVARLMQERPSVLVCLEAEPECCHRSRLAVPVSKKSGLPIVHLDACQHAACDDQRLRSPPPPTSQLHSVSKSASVSKLSAIPNRNLNLQIRYSIPNPTPIF